MFAQLYWQNQRNVCYASSVETPLLKRFDFHGVSLKFNFLFSGGAPEYTHLTLPNEVLVSCVLTAFLWNSLAVEWSIDLLVAFTDLAVLMVHSFCSKADIAMFRKRDERIVGIIYPANTCRSHV